jgi:hypothetical protein
MDDHESEALARMLKGEPFAAIAEVFGDQSEPAAAAAALLGRWLTDGVISRVVRSE